MRRLIPLDILSGILLFVNLVAGPCVVDAAEGPCLSESLPVIATRFEVRHSRLAAKLTDSSQTEIEKRLSASLARKLQNVSAVHFLNWSSEHELRAPLRAGTLQAFLDVVKEGKEVEGNQPYSILLCLEFSLENGTFNQLPPPHHCTVLYGNQDSKVPGSKGEIWKAAVEKRFGELSDKPDFGKELAILFSAAPLTENEDILENGGAKAIALYLCQQRVQASDRTVLSAFFRAKDHMLTQADLLVRPCLFGDESAENYKEWMERVQGMLESKSFQSFRARSRGTTSIKMKTYSRDYVNCYGLQP